MNPPESVEELRDSILNGNAHTYGQDANVFDFVRADDIVKYSPWLDEIESQWGPAPGKVQSDGKSVFIFVVEGRTQIDALVSLTGFSFVGGPAYNDSDAAVKVLKDLDVPYLAAHPLEFQTIKQWKDSEQGLGPIETTMLVALPELDGATNPTVFAGRLGATERIDNHGPIDTQSFNNREMVPCLERVAKLTQRTKKLCILRRKKCSERKVAIVIFGFPPNAGAAGTAAYLNVFGKML